MQMPDMPTWQVLLMHLPTMVASIASLVAACAAWRTASKGRKAAEEGRATSSRNENAINLLLNGAVEKH